LGKYHLITYLNYKKADLTIGFFYALRPIVFLTTSFTVLDTKIWVNERKFALVKFKFKRK